MAFLTAGPLAEEEENMLEDGAALFDAGKFWHAHESWEELWNMLKRRSAPSEEILLVQGLIQTAAMLLHHQRKNRAGVEKQWGKLSRNFVRGSTPGGLDVSTHLAVIETYAADAGTWTLVAKQHQLPRA